MNHLKIFVMGAAIMRVLLITDLFSGEAREWAQIVLIVLNMVTLGSTRLTLPDVVTKTVVGRSCATNHSIGAPVGALSSIIRH